MLATVHPEDFGLIRSGRKTALLLVGPRVFLMGPNTIDDDGGRLLSRGIAVVVYNITIKRVVDLHPVDQEHLGFASFARLEEAVSEADLQRGDTITVVRFHREGMERPA